MTTMTKEEIDCVIESINEDRTITINPKTKEMLMEKRGFFTLLILWKSNPILNYMYYFKLKEMYTWDRRDYAKNFVKQNVPLCILKEITKVYPQKELKKIVSDNVSLTYKGLGFDEDVIEDYISCYINNYAVLKKTIKKNKKQPTLNKDKKREKLLILIDNLYKESLE